MKELYILILLFLGSNLYAQAIRKNYLEMTETEKVNLVNAFYQLRTGADLVNDLANFHATFFNLDDSSNPTGLDIHFNLPDEPERDIFLAWHRRQMFEMEQAMQKIDSNLSLPYWDTSMDQSLSSPLWNQNFLGQFNNDWGLDRDLGDFGSLPTPQEITDVQAIVDFLVYSNTFERGTPHAGPHRWVGGRMRSSASPRDPVFYFHHTNVDRLWAAWQEVNQSSTFQRTSMIRYDGTYVFDGKTLPLVNPNDILNTRFFGTFYAVDGLSKLDNYTVSNTYNIQENFYYQFTIQAGNNFIIPSGSDCKFESVNEIILLPGFEANIGSSFKAVIDIQQNNKLSISKRGDEIVRNRIPFEDVGELVNVYDKFDNLEANIYFSEPFPNPFLTKITIHLTEKINKGEVIIYDLMGRIIKKQKVYKIDKIEITNLIELAHGIYILYLFDENNKLLINKKVIKM